MIAQLLTVVALVLPLSDPSIGVGTDPRYPKLNVQGRAHSPARWQYTQAFSRGSTTHRSTSSSQLRSHGLRCEEAPIAPQLWDCPDPEPQDTTVVTVTVTPGQVLTAVREIGLAAGRVSIQPSKGTTLVNLPTILSTQDTTLDTTVTLLGAQVEVKGTPVTYLWRHGDGTSQRTRTPGRPYPHKDITHRYLKPAKRVLVSVDITYRVSYRVGDGGWQDLTDTITTTGPATPLAVREVIPVLIHGDG